MKIPVIDTYLGASVRCTKATESSSILSEASWRREVARCEDYAGTAAPVVLAHAVVVFWHLELLARRDAVLKVDQVPLFAGLANIIPLIALISLWAHFPKLGAWLLLSLAVPLAIGGYSHFLSPGSDNVFRMAGGELTFAFRISAVLLFLLEFLGCWLGIQILRASSSSVASA